MVYPVGPGKFYGSTLPRPRIYTDIKFNHERIDPPISVIDPLLSWAKEAHWSMGGLSTKRLRLQGRIEGNIKKLRAENEKLNGPVSYQSDSDDEPPPTPVASLGKRRRLLVQIEDDESEEEEVRVLEKKKKKPARKLINEFNSVASNKSKSIGGSFVSKMLKASQQLKSTRAVANESGEEDQIPPKLKSVRTSPRLKKKQL